MDAPEPEQSAVGTTVIAPTPGEVITSLATGTSYVMGTRIGEGFFGVVYACSDGWDNDLAAKILKPIRTHDELAASALAEVQKLLYLRHPQITYVYDAFEFRDSFYIITERCYSPLTDLFAIDDFNGPIWIVPIARCLLQAVNFLHLNHFAHQDIHSGNVFTSFFKDEMAPKEPGAIHFKLGDLGVSKLFEELDAGSTLKEGIRPPEALDSGEFGPLDQRIDIYQLGLLFLQLAYSRPMTFSTEEILAGRPREMALLLEPPLNFALEKALRRHVAFRTETAEELWRDLHSPPGVPTQTEGDQSPSPPPPQP
jgi:serine/threonine protein kinase